MLTPLQDNGGPTFTMALVSGSPAIGAGDNTGGPNTDQRGFSRVVGAGGEIGAVESLGVESPSLVVTTDADESDNDGLISLREAISSANRRAGHQIITFDTGAFSGAATIALSGSELPVITGDLEIDGTGVLNLFIDAGNQSRIFEIASGATVSISGMTLQGGDGYADSSGSGDNSGGAILNHGTLTLTDSTITVTGRVAMRGPSPTTRP